MDLKENKVTHFHGKIFEKINLEEERLLSHCCLWFVDSKAEISWRKGKWRKGRWR